MYGNGSNIRDWLYVEDHIDAILLVLQNGEQVILIVLVVELRKLIKKF